MQQLFQTVLLTGLVTFMTSTYLTGAEIQSGDTTGNFAVEQKWTTEAVFDVPESVCYDESEDVLYVSNIVGKPSMKDGRGFISKLSIEGELIKLKWFEGLDAPKGMGIYNGRLFVTNIDEVVVIDLATRQEIKRYACEGASFANDIAINSNGVVFISGMNNGAIYKLYNNKIEKWFPEGTFENPNGLYAADEYLYIGTSKSICRAAYKNMQSEEFIKETLSVDGLKNVKDYFFIKSDWQGRVHITHPAKERQLLINTVKEQINAADIEYIPQKKLLLVPTFFNNRVTAYDLLEK